MRVIALCSVLGLLALDTAAMATVLGTTAATSRPYKGPYGVVLRAPATRISCAANGAMHVNVSARWSAAAIKRPVRSIRVLLQRPGAETVINSVSFAPARATTTRRATLASSTCRPNLDVRYELFVGTEDVPHDHQSVVFRTHGS